jgi:hypothetical protein
MRKIASIPHSAYVLVTAGDLVVRLRQKVP